MLWRKAWIETRWRFLIGLAVLVLSACGTVFDYPAVTRLLAATGPIDYGGGLLGRIVTEAARLEHTFRGFQWYHQNLSQMWTLFAILLGSGGLLAQTSGGTLFTLSLPASRAQVMGIRAATGLWELLVLAFVPSLIIPILSPAVGQTYGLGETLVHAFCMLVGGAAFFSIAFLLSTMLGDLWRPLLVTCGIAVVVALGEQALRGEMDYGIFHVMSGETYFLTGHLPWIGLSVSVAISAALLYGAANAVAAHDF
jgi:hypothetical protein